MDAIAEYSVFVIERRPMAIVRLSDGRPGDVFRIGNAHFPVVGREEMCDPVSGKITEVIYSLSGGEYVEVSLDGDTPEEIRVTRLVRQGVPQWAAALSRAVAKGQLQYVGVHYNLIGEGEGRLFVDGVLYGVVQWWKFGVHWARLYMRRPHVLVLCLDRGGDARVRAYHGVIWKTEEILLTRHNEPDLPTAA
jgi:hypothetical protein